MGIAYRETGGRGVFVEGNATPCHRLGVSTLGRSAYHRPLRRQSWDAIPGPDALPPLPRPQSTRLHRPHPTLGLPNSTADHTFNGPTTLEVMPTSPPEPSPWGSQRGPHRIWDSGTRDVGERQGDRHMAKLQGRPMRAPCLSMVRPQIKGTGPPHPSCTLLFSPPALIQTTSRS